MSNIEEYILLITDSFNYIPFAKEIGMFLLMILFLNFLLWRLAKYLRLLGYRFVYFFLSNINNFDYYTNTTNHISSVHEKPYKLILRFLKSYSYLFLSSTNRQMSKMVLFYKYADSLTEFFSSHFEEDHYFAFSEIKPYVNAEENIIKFCKSLSCKEFGRYICRIRKDKDFNWRLYLENPFDLKFEEMRLIHNKNFVQKELREKKRFFDTVLKYPLDQQQREAIVKLEDNCQVISSAGSGKTSTSIAKVKYLLDKRKYNPGEILVLSYNRATAAEFKLRLGRVNIECSTFHSLARRIVGKVERTMPDVCSKTFLMECFYDIVSKNPEYKQKINEYFAERVSATQCEHNYKSAKDYFVDRATYGVFCPYTDRNGNIIYTKSEEEKKICVWLVHNGIEFEYERPYHVEINDPEHRQYKPDFSIFFKKNGKETFVYYEHFGIDKNGDVPIWFGENSGGYEKANRDYNEGILWKRATHRNYNTGLIETTSAMFHDGTIFDKLKRQLQQFGIETHPISENEKFEKLFRLDCMMRENVKTFFESFLSLMKSNRKTIDSIMEEVEATKKVHFIERNRFLLYEIIKPLFEKYQASLKEKRQIDFVDMIMKATYYLNKGVYTPNFRYILVDEFQDISIDRFRMLQALRSKDPLTKLFCVGDDWQSIYRFAGSDINLFSKFEKHFGFTEICKIETTYRFGNTLIEKSSKFILKNRVQVPKEVSPVNKKIITDIQLKPYNGKDNLSQLEVLKNIISAIPANESIKLIGRYNADVWVFPKNTVQQEEGSKRATVMFMGRSMNFISIHSAKGLEADNVIILNCSSDSRGFPSRVADDPILGYVLSETDNYPFSEERRLFYVAITRSKKKTYILYNAAAPSVFVTEMQGEENSLMLCPLCQNGNLVQRYQQKNLYNDAEFRIYTCSNLAAHCNFKWILNNIRSENDVLFTYKSVFRKAISGSQKTLYEGPSEHPVLHSPDAKLELNPNSTVTNNKTSHTYVSSTKSVTPNRYSDLPF